MKRLPRKAGWWTGLGVAFTAVVMAATSAEEGTPKTPRPAAQVQGKAASYSPVRAQQAQPEAVQVVELDRLRRPHATTDVGNAFGTTSWYVPPPPPPPPPPAPPPVPTAPPLPFTYLGRYEEAPTRLAILVNGERMYTVAAGDVIEGTYRIERVTPGMVELTYLPLNIKQTLGTGEAL
jgi:hypothetical protein